MFKVSKLPECWTGVCLDPQRPLLVHLNTQLGPSGAGVERLSQKLSCCVLRVENSLPLCFAASYLFAQPPRIFLKIFLFNRREKWATLWRPALAFQLQGQARPWKSEQPGRRGRRGQCTQQLQRQCRTGGGDRDPAEACALHIW